MPYLWPLKPAHRALLHDAAVALLGASLPEIHGLDEKVIGLDQIDVTPDADIDQVIERAVSRVVQTGAALKTWADSRQGD